MTMIDVVPPRPAAGRKALSGKMVFLLAFHAVLSGAFIVAYLTGDEDTYGMHVFSGYAVLSALSVRVAVGLLVPAKSPLALPRPALRPALDWLGRTAAGDRQAWRRRSPLLAWMTAVLLAGVGLIAASGAVADVVVRLEDLHEALGEMSLALVFGHLALVLGLQALKRAATPSTENTPS